MEDFEASIALRRSQSLAVIVQKEIERMIVGGELPAGTRLNELALAAKFGVSRGPIREAMRALESANLISTRMNQGFYVREPTPKEIGEVYEVRAAIYGYICGLLARSASKDDIRRLMSFVERMDAAIAKGDVDDYYQLNLAFHDATLACSENDCANRTYRTLINQTQLARRRALGAPERMHESNQEHRDLLAAILAGDAALARQLGEGHVLAGHHRWEVSR